MAQLLAVDTDTDIATFSRRSVLAVLLIGAIVGVLTWALVLLFEHVIIEPLFCSSVNSFNVCSHGGSIAGNLATVFATVFGAFALVRYGYYRPLVIAVAGACVLWGLSRALGGLSWIESLIWMACITALAYVTFAWLTRIRLFTMMAIIVIVAVLIVRVATLS